MIHALDMIDAPQTQATESQPSHLGGQTQSQSASQRLLTWVLSWANHPASPWALFILAFAESSFFPIPPDVLLIALAFGRPQRSFFFATICTLGSVLGGMFGYAIGLGFWHLVGDFFLDHIIAPTAFGYVGNLYNQHTFWAVFSAGFTPIPYKVFTVTAGVFQISFAGFIIASLLGRGGRFFLVATGIYFFGDRARALIERHLGILSIAFTLALIGGFILIKYLV